MSDSTKYLHDRSILLLLAINAILLVVGVLLVLSRLDAGKGSGYFIQYRANVGIGEFKTGSSLDMSGFIFFMLINLGLAILISVRSYHERRHIAIATLMMTGLLGLLAIIVSDALLVLR